MGIICASSPAGHTNMLEEQWDGTLHGSCLLYRINVTVKRHVVLVCVVSKEQLRRCTVRGCNQIRRNYFRLQWLAIPAIAPAARMTVLP